jgi:hypothetical protein
MRCRTTDRFPCRIGKPRTDGTMRCAPEIHGFAFGKISDYHAEATPPPFLSCCPTVAIIFYTTGRDSAQ